MFRTVPLSIIRSFALYTEQWYVIQVCWQLAGVLILTVCNLYSGYIRSFFPLAQQPPSGPGPPHSQGILDHTQRRNTVSWTPLGEWSARRRDLYLTTHNTHNRQTSMPPVGFEPTISARETPQTGRPLGPAHKIITGTNRRWKNITTIK